MIKRKKLKGSKKTKVTFVIPHRVAEPRIYVTGEFNKWKCDALPMVKRSNGTRSVSVELRSKRRYAFRYVTTDGKWFNDDSADAYEPSGFGTDNSVIDI